MERQPKSQHCEGEPNPPFISHPQVCTHSPLGCTGTMCPAWVSGAGAVQEGHRQCKPQTSFREGATANLEITPHVPVTRTSHPPPCTFLPLLHTLAWSTDAGTNPAHTRPSARWNDPVTAVCWGCEFGQTNPRKALRGAPSSSSVSFTPRPGEDEGVIYKMFSFRGKGQSVGSPSGSLLMVRCDLFDIC